MKKISIWLKVFPLCYFLAACETVDIKSIQKKPLSFLKSDQFKVSNDHNVSTDHGSKSGLKKVKLLSAIIGEQSANVDVEAGFKNAIIAAIAADPGIIAGREKLNSAKAGTRVVEGKREFQVSGAVYGGIEDVTDQTSGIALVLSANRLIFDGGQIENEILAKQYSAESLEHSLAAQIDNRALELATLWVDLERYRDLHSRIESRLGVLDPLISQLEKVAESGLGDVTQVSAAQRTVSAIRVRQTEVFDNYENAKLRFLNSFGSLPVDSAFDESLTLEAKSTEISDEMVRKAPALLAAYSDYLSAEASLAAIKAKESFNFGFESRLTRPLGGSGYDSDESIGFVARKTFYVGDTLESQITQAEAIARNMHANVVLVLREGTRKVKSAQQMVISMQSAIELARENAKVTADEIRYLKQQLVIGGSTLDSVLSAEARLYEAEAQEINFMAELRKAHLIILASLGLLSGLLDQ